MSEAQERRKARKGTTSCTECRRRKIRCIREPEGASICQRCQGKSLECTVQIYSSHNPHQPRLSSRHRISQLESQVASLSGTLQSIESKLGCQHSQHSPIAIARSTSSPGFEESDEDSSGTDVIESNPPTHLQSLFQNDWLSVDTHNSSPEHLKRKAKVSSHLHNIARRALQDLIPSLDDVFKIAKTATKWLVLLHALLPQPFSVNSEQEMLAMYDDMRKPNVDPMILAAWLLTIGLAAQQMPGDPDCPVQLLERFLSFPKIIADTVERTILQHDKLTCTIPGVAVALPFFRLKLGQGNLQKVWLGLRHFISIAELLGLPKTFQLVQSNRTRSLPSSTPQIQRAQLWEALTFVDGLFGTLINLPPCTAAYRQTKLPVISAEGEVIPRAYMGKLTDVTTKIQYDDMNTLAHGSLNDQFAAVMELDRQLQVLASETPEGWWVLKEGTLDTGHVVQFMHHCIRMRVHLSFAMRQDLDAEYMYSRLSCISACEAVASRYILLRKELPAGTFICQILDLQTFTAAVVLLLNCHGAALAEGNGQFGQEGGGGGGEKDRARVRRLVDEVVEVMNVKSGVTPGFGFAQHGVATIRALSGLLNQNPDIGKGDGNPAVKVKELTLKIPLLGKVHIRRNSNEARQSSNTPTTTTDLSQTQPATINSQTSNYDPPQSQTKTPTSIQKTRYEAESNLQYMPAPQQLQPQQQIQVPVSYPATTTDMDWNYDPLSWSVENQFDGLFQDTLFMEDMDQFTQFNLWQPGLNQEEGDMGGRYFG